jgi:hypothetical protein
MTTCKRKAAPNVKNDITEPLFDTKERLRCNKATDLKKKPDEVKIGCASGEKKKACSKKENLKSTPTFAEASKTVFGLAINPIIGSFFHPMYSIVNAAVLGHANDPI